MLSWLKHHLGFVVITFALLTLVVWGFIPKPLPVEVVSVKAAPFSLSVEEDGMTRVIDRYVIASPVNGMTCRMHLQVGDDVQHGQTLLGITPLAPQVLDARSRSQAKAQVSAAQAALAAAKQQAQSSKVQADLMNSEFQRYPPLLAKDLISQERFNQAQSAAKTAAADYRSALFQVEVAGFELQAAQTALLHSFGAGQMSGQTPESERVSVTSPVDGKILKVNRQCEGPVVTGEALLEVGDPSALEVVVDVLSADAVKIQPGMTVEFERWGGDFPLKGLVKRIEPTGFTKVSALGVEEQRVWVVVDFASPAEQWQRLGDGYRVEAKFLLWQDDDVLQIPTSALFRYQNGWAVFKVLDDSAQITAVTLQRRNGRFAQIASGLLEGDTVVNHPSDELSDHSSITIRQIEIN